MFSFICVPKKEYMEKAVRKAYELGFSQTFINYGRIDDMESSVETTVRKFTEYWDIYKEDTALFLGHSSKDICYGNILDEDEEYHDDVAYEEILVNYDSSLFDQDKDFLL